MFKVQVTDGAIYQNGVAVATCHGGYLMGIGSGNRFMFRSRKGNSEAISFAKHMFKVLTADEIIAGVAISSPVEFGAFHGWTLPHIKTWVKNGRMAQVDADRHLAHFANQHAQKVS